MAISIKKLTLNTKVNKHAKEQSKAQKSFAKGLSKMDRESLIQECLDRVRDLIDHELRP
ncbi:hypothetical protein [Aureispira anguillae]|uniref:Uncharacterized protein n=1 Tax=Aureispira anguillae TaxID=2864201 RepID=A0A915YIT9_9BACT|nr:hypothetical protein [Aureispira anguillae]BDS13997.1 hypothetical protein AsAng_0047600 [Aureispira anguillae]